MQRTHRGVALDTVFDENGTHRGITKGFPIEMGITNPETESKLGKYNIANTFLKGGSWQHFQSQWVKKQPKQPLRSLADPGFPRGDTNLK